MGVLGVVQNMKCKIGENIRPNHSFAEGAIAGERPGNAADIRLISGGRFIEDGVSVQGEVTVD